ncbi:MAG TPA: class I SAM-dependent methyltransferase [Pyrinomonadaceae bacterium]|jgi:SAM-dependent methyltransferase
MTSSFSLKRKLLCACLLLLAATGAALLAQTRPQARRVVYLSYEDAKPFLEAGADILPQGLKGKSQPELARDWPNWVVRRDAEIRARLLKGDEDTLVNFLLFGTSYTKQPRITQQQLNQIGQQQPNAAGTINNPALAGLANSLQARADDLLRAMAAPGSNDRLLFARRLLAEQKGFRLDTPEGRAKAKAYLLESVVHVLGEFSNYAKILETARAQGASEEFIERSNIFRTRGLSSDTTLLPNYAIEEALKAILARKLLAPGTVRRVAIIGPGLDFTDKQEGYDFYPQQSIQPFALIDSLLRLGLTTRADALQVTTFDLSPRVNDHLERARERAQRGQGYVLQLPYDTQARWKPEAVRYWEQFGDRIGSPMQAIAAPSAISTVKMRSLQVRPAIAALITPLDTNIVLQRLDIPAAERFDLIIATNILVYYDTFEQSLALANIERMLRPGGFLLSNNALVELPFSRMHSVDYSTVVYSERAGDGDHIVWYQRAAD